MSSLFDTAAGTHAFWYGFMATIALVLAIFHLYIKTDMEHCYQNRHVQAQLNKLPAIRREQVLSGFTPQQRKSLQDTQPYFDMTNFSHIVYGTIYSIMLCVGVYGAAISTLDLYV